MQIGKIYQHHEFFRNTKLLKSSSCFFLFGSEDYLKDKILNVLLKKFSSDDSSDFDTVKFYADDTTAAIVVEQLEMMPFLGEYKIVVLKNFDNFRKSDKDTIAEYLKNPVESSILILDSAKADKRTNIFKIINKLAISVECKSPYGFQDILLWLKNELSSKDVRMDNETANLFASYIQPNYLIASNELEKLIIASNNSKIITAEDVAECVGRSRSNSIFDLQNALGEKDLRKSLIILENLLSNNESAIFIITMLTTFFRNIWKILILRKNKIRESEISSAYLKDIFYSFREDYLKYSRNYNIRSVRVAFSHLLKTDIALKSIDIKEIILLETLIFNICKEKK